MTPDKFKSTEESQSNLNVFRDARFIIISAIITALSSSCNFLNKETIDTDYDLAGLPDDSGDHEASDEYIKPVVEKDTDPIIICEEIPITDAGVETEEVPITETELYKDVVKALRLKNNRM